MTILNYITIRSARSLKKLIIAGLNLPAQNHLHIMEFIGIYNARICGLCIYRSRQRWVGLKDFLKLAQDAKNNA